MCELLGLECNVPTDIGFSFTGFAQRGGGTGPHADGWGLALYENRLAHAFVESEPAFKSPLVEYVRTHSRKTLLAVAHVRRKTRGHASVENTHPFVRALWGRHWVFAHNGTLPDVFDRRLTRQTPIGDTDSEYAFCWMLERLEESFPGGYPEDDVRRLWKAVADIGGELGATGKFNFLLGDARHLFARCGTRLCHIVRKAPFGVATLKDADVQIDFAQHTTPRDRVAVVATEPLTRDETWQVGAPGTLWVFDEGQVQATLPSLGPGGTTWSPEDKAPDLENG